MNPENECRYAYFSKEKEPTGTRSSKSACHMTIVAFSNEKKKIRVPFLAKAVLYIKYIKFDVTR
jgi:hypothetical protein